MSINRYIDDRQKRFMQQKHQQHLTLQAEQEMRAKLAKDYAQMQDYIKKSTSIRSRIMQLILEEADTLDIILHLLKAVELMTHDNVWQRQAREIVIKRYARE